MSQTLKDKVSCYTGNDEIQFSISVDIFTQPTYAHNSKTQTVSLEIPDNEPLEDAEKDMEDLARNGINCWED